MGAAGHPVIETPTLDALARSGTRFSRAYSECPVCVPARRSLMTGMSPRAHGDRIFQGRLAMPPVPTLADAFTGSRQRLDWQDFAVDAGLVDWRRLSDVNLTIDELTVNNTVPIDHLIGSTERIDAHLLDIPEQHDAAKGTAALSLYAEASAIDAPGFAVADGTLDIEAELNGLPDALAVYGHPDLLRRIEAAGGKLNLVGLRGADETTSFELTGMLGLDDAMRLDGQLRLVSTGLVERLDGLVPQQMQPLIVGQPADDGSYSQTLTFKGGVIFSGLVPVGMVPPLGP